MNTKKILNYIHECRWCDFKKKIEDNQISTLTLDQLPFDNNNMLFVIGEVTFDDNSKRFFSMPLAIKDTPPEKGNFLSLNDGYYYTDATLEPNFWQSFSQLMKENNGIITFPNGWSLESTCIHNSNDMMQAYPDEISKALGVEQSNTTLKIGNGKLAFKLERMLEFSPYINSEFEMNEKLMREGATFMPKTYGGLIWRRPDGVQASGGIIQEFVPNKGDMWKYLKNILQEKLRINYLIQKDITASDNQEFMDLIRTLSLRTKEMNNCLSRPDENEDFSPKAPDAKFIHSYEKNLQVLLYKTKKDIIEKIADLPSDTAEKAKDLIMHWEEYTHDFIAPKIQAIKEGKSTNLTHRVHGDFHLGQVMVTPDNDLRIIDFAGEPALSMKERKQKYISVRDIAGMYRSIKGYLGAVAVEDYTANAPSTQVKEERKKWGLEAIKPLINEASKEFLGDAKLSDPWLSLEILRKNLYEVRYEVTSRPEYAYIPINGLADLFNKPSYDHANENIFNADHKII